MKIIFFENTCVEWFFTQKNNLIKFTALKFVKSFYEELRFYNTPEVLLGLKEYLDRKVNLFNFNQWFQTFEKIGMGTFAKVLLINFFNVLTAKNILL